MATDKQIEANRRNAQHCTGPKSASGKATSSQNALKTGLHAKSDVIATESHEDYETLIAEYYVCHQPATPEQRSLVDDLIRSEWLGRRYMAATAGIWNRDFLSMKEQDMGRAFMRNSEALSRAQRCITATQRNHAHTLKQLHALQAKHPAELPSYFWRTCRPVRCSEGTVKSRMHYAKQAMKGVLSEGTKGKAK